MQEQAKKDKEAKAKADKEKAKADKELKAKQQKEKVVKDKLDKERAAKQKVSFCSTILLHFVSLCCLNLD